MEWNFPTICFAVTRAIHFFTCLLILGVWIFDRLVVCVIRESAPFWPRIARRQLLISLPAALLTGIAWFGFVAIAMSGLPARDALQFSVLKVVWSQTYFGTVWKWRGVIFVCSLITAIGKSPASKVRAWIAMFAGIALVGSLAFSGHGQTGLWPGWHLAGDAVHLLIAAVWPMGLLPFALVLWEMRRAPVLYSPSPGTPGEGRGEGPNVPSQRKQLVAEREGPHPCPLPEYQAREKRSQNAPAIPGEGEILKLTRRFSAMSLISVGVLLLSGIVNGWCLLGSFSALVNIDYGRVLLVKIGLFLGMMGLAAVNRFILMPRLEADQHGESVAARRLQINVMIELALMTAVLLVTGLLGTLMPAQM